MQPKMLLFAGAFLVLIGVIAWIFQPVIKSWSHKEIEYDVFDRYTLGKAKSKEEKIELSVVFPAYNEEKRLSSTLDSAFAFLLEWSKREGFTFEVVVVNDGSKDSTVSVAKRYYEKYPEHFRLVSLRKNRGKGAAMKVGVAVAQGKYVLMADADGATNIEDAETLMKRMKILENKYDDNRNGVVVGSRAHLADKSIATRAFYRTILMKGFHFLVVLLCTRNIQDTQCGFKLFTNHVAKTLFTNLHLNRWAFDIEIIYQAESLGFHMDEVSVNWREVEGSKLIQSKLDVVTTSLVMARDMLAVRLAYLFGLWQLPRVSSSTNKILPSSYNQLTMLMNLPKDEDDPQIGKAIPEALEEILNNVATTGRLSQPWEEVRLLFRWKLCKVFDQYFASCGFVGPITQSYESRKREILFLFDQFTVEPPFTLQRFAEVLQRSWSQYRATHTIMNGVSKLLSVSPGGYEE